MSDKAPTGHFGERFGGNTLPTSASVINHIFGSRPGHLPDTPKNRQLLVDVANNKNNCLGIDKNGNRWFARIESDGSQTWVVCRNGTIRNGGQNNPPRSWDSDTGLSRNPYRKR